MFSKYDVYTVFIVSYTLRYSKVNIRIILDKIYKRSPV